MSGIDWSEIGDTVVSFLRFETRVITVGVLLLALCAVNIEGFVHWRRMKKKETASGGISKPVLFPVSHSKPSHDGKKEKWVFWMKSTRLIAVNAVLILLCAVITVSTLCTRPHVIRTVPEEGATFESAQPQIEIEFDIPVHPDAVVFNISPDIKGEWEFKPVIPGLSLARKVVFHPSESLYPEGPVVIYITGIQTITGIGKMHEQDLQFNAPIIPDLADISPPPGSVDVRTDIRMILEYDAPVGEFVDTEVAIEPAAEFNLVIDGTSQVVEFSEPLDQNAHYTVAVFQTPRSFDIQTGENLHVGATRKIGTTDFTTVTAPGISSFEPSGEGVLVTAPITVVFDKDMIQESVEHNFSIVPDVSGTVEWKDKRTFVYTPEVPFAKETRYTVTFSRGMYSQDEGITEEDTVIMFTTIGRVKVASVYPVSGSYGIDPNSTNVSITFDQQVDQISAQGSFSISPYVPVSFSWDGNTMTVMTAGKLNFSTRYTFSLGPGIVSVNGIDSSDTYSYSFTTRDNMFVLAVPQYYQPTGFSCNLTAAKMALAYRGVYVGIDAIQSSLGLGGDPNSSWVDGYGTHWGPIATYISQYRVATGKQGWTLSQILHEVQNGNPVVLFWYNRYSQPPGAFTLPSGVTGYMGMHSEVVKGFVGSPDSPTAILTNDPWRGSMSYSPSLFMSTWAYIGYAAVVVY